MRVIKLDETLTERNGASERVITALIKTNDGTSTISIDETHPSWGTANHAVSDFKSGVVTNEELASALFDSVNLIAKVENKLTTVTGVIDGRMRVEGNSVTIDGDSIDPILESHILRLLRADGTPKDHVNWTSFARFVENLYANMNENVRKQLFGWMSYEQATGRGFTITPDGCFIGYKGCKVGEDGTPMSINTGTAIADGVRYNGAIPNKVGTIVEMARGDVQDDPAVGCSVGLHVGTYDYASNWARGVLLTVKVNPRDVVSVPTECNAQKIRTCRYEILETTEVAYTEPTWGDDDEYDEDDYWGEDEDCDCDECLDDCDEDCCTSDGDSLDDFEAGDKIAFEYLKKSGERKSYVITTDDVTDYYVTGVNEYGDTRTFIRSNMTDIEILEAWEDREAADNTDSSIEANDDLKTGTDKIFNGIADALVELFGNFIDPKLDEAPVAGDDVVNDMILNGDTVTFDYEKKDGSVKEYTVTITDIKLDRILGTDSKGQFKSFKLDRIKGLNKAIETVEDKDGKASFNDVLTEIITAVAEAVKTFDPEVEEEIKRNGFASDFDPWA